jgi:hypothetical protein
VSCGVTVTRTTVPSGPFLIEPLTIRGHINTFHFETSSKQIHKLSNVREPVGHVELDSQEDEESLNVQAGLGIDKTLPVTCLTIAIDTRSWHSPAEQARAGVAIGLVLQKTTDSGTERRYKRIGTFQSTTGACHEFWRVAVLEFEIHPRHHPEAYSEDSTETEIHVGLKCSGKHCSQENMVIQGVRYYCPACKESFCSECKVSPENHDDCVFQGAHRFVRFFRSVRKGFVEGGAWKQDVIEIPAESSSCKQVIVLV